jgi:mRNA-degrading endonuclease RelE of RelBE toxin-antitoxin system
LTWVVFRPKRFKDDLRRLTRRYRGLDRDFERLLQEEVATRPETAGDRIPGLAFDVRKARLPIPSQGIGKRGGLRLVFSLDFDTRTIIPLVLYAKRESEDIARTEIEAARDSCEAELRRQFAERGYDPDLVKFLRAGEARAVVRKEKAGSVRKPKRG